MPLKCCTRRRGSRSSPTGKAYIDEEFARRPANVHLLTRAAQNRLIKTATGQTTSLFAMSDDLPEQARFVVTIPAAPGRKQRSAELALRYAPVLVRSPKNGAAPDLPKTIPLTLLDIRGDDDAVQGEPIHWRLITTHTIDSPSMARMVLDFYRRRWIIEDYFLTLNTVGFDIEAAEIEDPNAMTRLVGAVAIAGVTVLQLVRARDGTTDQMLEEAFVPPTAPSWRLFRVSSKARRSVRRTPTPRARLPKLPGSSPASEPGMDTTENRVQRSCAWGFRHSQLIKYGHQLGPKNV